MPPMNHDVNPVDRPKSGKSPRITSQSPRLSDDQHSLTQHPHSADSVYKNLIITEHALRSQYIELQRSRRQGLLFIWSMLIGAALLTYRVKHNASFFWMIRLIEQLLMIALYIAVGLFFLTGLYTKTFTIAPRFLSDTNKGLKSLNFRLVKTKVSFAGKIIRLLYDPVYATDPAGPVKLTLSTREFTPNYIEDWEVFRDEYWQRQHRRKRRLKQKRRRSEKSDKSEKSEKPEKPEKLEKSERPENIRTS